MSDTEQQQLLVRARQHRELIERLFDRDAALYPDVRHLARPDQIRRRLKQISVQLHTLPPKKLTCRRNRPLLAEYSLLRAKHACLTAVDPDEDGDLMGARAIVELTNASATNKALLSAEQQAYHRRAHTVMLMHFIFGKYTVEQLSQMLAES
jgi:hypothetical protein